MQENTVKLELSVNDLNIVLAGIAKLPIEAAYGTFNSIQQQAEQQLGKPNSNQLQGPLANKVLN
jgi:hypothetical protein